jgi:hypothetical protein
MSEVALQRIASLLESTDEADDALRGVVEVLVAEPEVDWAAVAFLEEGTLTVGPVAGSEDSARRARTPITFAGDVVGELLVDGAADPVLLSTVAELIAPQVLIGWDTGGEPWEP